MDGLSVNHSFFETLRQEHHVIRENLELVLTQADRTPTLRWLWQHVELLHHAKEEKILFNFLLDNPHVNGGGPLCMLYLDNYILNSPLDRAQRLTGKVPALENHMQKLFDAASAMRIPANEHRAGKEILRFLIDSISQISNEQQLKLLKEYREIQLEHMSKEENCFFFHCANLLTPSEADALLLNWQSTAQYE